MATSKQKLQRDRAYFKYVLTGLPKPIVLASLSEEERINWNTIINLISSLVNQFDKNSRELGLNVPEHKCWCGKEGKYNSSIPGKYVCKKHVEF